MASCFVIPSEGGSAVNRRCPAMVGNGVVDDTMSDQMTDPRELEYEKNAIGNLAD